MNLGRGVLRSLNDDTKAMVKSEVLFHNGVIQMGISKVKVKVRLATSRALGEWSEPCFAAKRHMKSDEGLF